MFSQSFDLESSAPQTKKCNVSAECHWRLIIRSLF